MRCHALPRLFRRLSKGSGASSVGAGGRFYRIRAWDTHVWRERHADSKGMEIRATKESRVLGKIENEEREAIWIWLFLFFVFCFSLESLKKKTKYKASSIYVLDINLHLAVLYQGVQKIRIEVEVLISTNPSTGKSKIKQTQGWESRSIWNYESRSIDRK